MKKLLLLFVLLISLNAKGQYVTIPDTALVAYLQYRYPSCMNGNQMDTLCLLSVNDTIFNINYCPPCSGIGIHDISIIKYFPNLKHLICPYNLTTLPNLPNSLITLYCGGDSISTFPPLPSGLKYFSCSFANLSTLPSLPNSLVQLICGSGNLTTLPSLPNSITYLDCSNNQIAGSFPPLPNSLKYFDCSFNSITNLPSLPNNLEELNCRNNLLHNLSPMPNTLKELKCAWNLLDSLPPLSDSLTLLSCWYNQLTSLPLLTNSLTDIDCSDNLITSIPPIPNSILSLDCSYNSLTNLPVLPNLIEYLDCSYNQISCFPSFPNSLTAPNQCKILNNPFTCLPNYVQGMNSTILSYQICEAGDIINNPMSCPASVELYGYTYNDSNFNCFKDISEFGCNNIKVDLMDSVGNPLKQTYSSLDGNYYFTNFLGSSIVKIDTTNKPFTLNCPIGNDSIITYNLNNTIITDVNFDIDCKPGYDVGAQSIMHFGPIFPGQQHSLQILAGDLSQWYQLNCASGISGQVQITVTGSITYNGITSNALTPTISGNTYTYNVSDFGNVNIQNAFGLIFTTDTTAQAGDLIYVNVNITPTNGDNNPSNNSFTHYYQVSNSLDPNYKSVYPTNVSPLYNDWLTYTIHFQNTGNAAAHNIRLLDTLSNNLDLNTFEVINYSHYNKVYLNGNILTVTYPNIMLPDSLSDPVGSQGFVQYRIKSKPGLQLGTQIKNTAYIYFDYNSPVVTNTAVSEFTTTSIKNINASQLQVYPNPTTGKLTVKIKDNKASINLYNQLGERLIQMNNISQQTEIDLSGFPAGMYYLQLRTGDGVETVKVVKE